MTGLKSPPPLQVGLKPQASPPFLQVGLKPQTSPPHFCFVLRTRNPLGAEGDLGGGYENLENSKTDKNSTNALNSSENSQILQNSKIENSNNAKNTHPLAPLVLREGESLDSNQKSLCSAKGDLGIGGFA